MKCPNNKSSDANKNAVSASAELPSCIFLLFPPSVSLSPLTVCHSCGLCGDVSLLRMDSPAQKRPYYIYILLHHLEAMPAGLQNLGHKAGGEAKRRAREEERRSRERLGLME